MQKQRRSDMQGQRSTQAKVLTRGGDALDTDSTQELLRLRAGS
jgi:hypothetical protein